MRSSVSRRGLYDIDGRHLDDVRVEAAYFGSAVDIDTVGLAVADAVNNICGDEVSRICLECCLENGYWPPDWWSEVRRYADDIVADWRRHGAPLLTSLYDTCLDTIRNIREIGSRLPLRRLPPSECFVGGIIGNGPKSIQPALPVSPYTLGEGHSELPDGLTHPLIRHLASGETCALKSMLASGQYDGYTPHRKSGCDRPLLSEASPSVGPGCEPHSLPPRAIQDGKIAMIRKLVAEAGPTYASLHEEGGRHSLLMHGDGMDVASVDVAAGEIRDRFGTPFDCLVVDGAALDDLMGDADGNDAKLMVSNGHTLAGEDPVFRGDPDPPRPAEFTEDDMLRNMERHGFEMIGSMPGPGGRSLRPEYVITATHFSMEPRWFIAGVAVMLCACRINWRLLLYLADVYGYAGTLYGVADSLCRQGRDFRWPVDMWRRREIRMVATEDDTIRKALRVYRC